MDLLDPLPCSLRQLQYLLAVADLRRFGRAAARCHVSQPSLSAQVAQVEDALGVRIFERNRRAVRVTSAGAPVIELARRVLATTRELVDIAREQADPFAGTLRVGVIPTVCPYLLPAVTVVLRKRWPRLTFVWHEDKTPALVARLAAGGLDAAILAKDRQTAGLETVELGHDPFVLAAPPDHPLVRSSKPLSPAALEGARVLLLDDGHCFRDQALAICTKSGADEAEYRATSLTTLVQMAVNTEGVTLLPVMALPVENRAGQLATRPFVRPTPERTIVLAWRAGSVRQRTLAAVGDAVRAAFVVTPPKRPSRRGAGPARATQPGTRSASGSTPA
ncbi:MAG: LysR family transcriptional regulator [Acidimicrobiia bacterium]|nr:LysR family transcriptional regulator [Acidimicrobiia bacterium]